VHLSDSPLVDAGLPRKPREQTLTLEGPPATPRLLVTVELTPLYRSPQGHWMPSRCRGRLMH
jgi:hypothetical protein